jgi:DNA invertase Pin-like site-specific DNA recombinase
MSRGRSAAGSRGPNRARNAIGYISTFPYDAKDPDLESDAQRDVIVAECGRRGWKLSAMFEDVQVGANAQPALEKALAALGNHESPALIVAKLDRLSLPLLDFASLLEEATREGWTLCTVELGVDTSSPSGEMIARIISTFAQLERRLMGQRTREALALTRSNGVKLGRPRVVEPVIRTRIIAERSAGRSLRAIASDLTLEGIPTARGGSQWYASSVRQIAESA